MEKDGYNLAQAAHNKAVDANHLASQAVRDIANHEKICAERYADMKEIMREIKASISKVQTHFDTSQTAMQTSINSLSNASHESIGMWKGIAVVSLGIGIIYTVLRITNIVP